MKETKIRRVLTSYLVLKVSTLGQVYCNTCDFTQAEHNPCSKLSVPHLNYE